MKEAAFKQKKNSPTLEKIKNSSTLEKFKDSSTLPFTGKI
jgi:hypothetical protein